MYLSELRLQNFRACVDTTVRLEKDLTVLVGENNGGKTSVLDALRLLTTPSDGRRTRYPELRDVHRDQPDKALRLEATFARLSPSQKGWFLTALTAPTATTAILGYEWTPPSPGLRPSRPLLTVGRRRSQDPEPAIRDVIRHVHLAALRDATRDLASSAPGRIEFLLRHLMGTQSKAKEQALLNAAKSAFDGLMRADETLQAASQRVAQEFNPLTNGFHPHEARLEFADATLVGLARDLRFRLSQRGVDLADLAETGLGYANLLYLASVLVELAAAKDAELTLLLVEEPEAHLHPQLQAVTLELLRRRARESRERMVEPGQRAGGIQVIVTTHSPNLASSVPCDHIVIMRSILHAEPSDGEIRSDQSSMEEDAERGSSSDIADANSGSNANGTSSAVRSPTSEAVAVSRLKIEPRLLRKVDRYLDVTRSGMLFSRRVLLVEGLAEALLIPVFARQLFKTDSPELNRFHGISVVAIDGVDFEPFVRLLLRPEVQGGLSIAELVVAVTDDDASAEEETSTDTADASDDTKAGAAGHADEETAVSGDEADDSSTDDASEDGETASVSDGERRKQELRAIAEEYGVADRLKVCITPVTFEYALIDHCGEDADKLAVIEAACAKMHATAGWVRRRREQFRREVTAKPTAAERALAFMDVFVNKRKFRKGDFAQLLAAEIEPSDGTPQPFGVPRPFAEALKLLVKVP